MNDRVENSQSVDFFKNAPLLNICAPLRYFLRPFRSFLATKDLVAWEDYHGRSILIVL